MTEKRDVTALLLTRIVLYGAVVVGVAYATLAPFGWWPL